MLATRQAAMIDSSTHNVRIGVCQMLKSIIAKPDVSVASYSHRVWIRNIRVNHKLELHETKMHGNVCCITCFVVGPSSEEHWEMFSLLLLFVFSSAREQRRPAIVPRMSSLPRESKGRRAIVPLKSICNTGTRARRCTEERTNKHGSRQKTKEAKNSVVYRRKKRKRNI